jgi:hypothetical protein
MHKQFLTKKYWLRVAVSFLGCFLIYSIISYFIDEKQNYWHLTEIQERLVYAFFMSAVFAYRQREQPQFSPTTGKNEFVKIKWRMKDFLSIFGLTLLFSILIMNSVFGLAYLATSLFTESIEPIGKLFLKMTVFTAFMCLFAIFTILLCDRFGIRWDTKS